jgi:hypothetical protein
MPRSQSRRASPYSHVLQRRKLHAKAYSGRSLATLAACIQSARSAKLATRRIDKRTRAPPGASTEMFGESAVSSVVCTLREAAQRYGGEFDDALAARTLSSVEASTLEELLCILLESRSDALREIVRSVCTWPRGHDFTDAVVGELSHTARAELVLARSRTMLIDHQEDLTSPVLDDALASGRAASAMVAYELAENPSEVDWTSTAAERALQEVRRAVSPPSSSGIGAQYQTVTTEPPANDAPTAIATLAKSLDGKLRLEPPASPTLGVPPRPEPPASPTLGVPPRLEPPASPTLGSRRGQSHLQAQR